jgi:GTP cyclohydrolase IB
VNLEDVQNSPAEHPIPIDKVGVKGLRFPIVVLDMNDESQHTVASISMSVALPHHFKGTHMSRFIEVLNAHEGEMTMRTLPQILDELKDKLETENAHIEVRFPYFIKRSAPKSGAQALMDYDCHFIGESNTKGCDFVFGVRVPVTTLCPCSKSISDYGAHNQRGYITIDVRMARQNDGNPAFVWIEELIDIAEDSASGPVYALLKRPDERAVTMKAFDNPVFVEDVVRNVATRLKEDARISWFQVHVENHESIHSHNAFAEIADNDRQHFGGI